MADRLLPTVSFERGDLHRGLMKKEDLDTMGFKETQASPANQ
jgi:hypothetical protein